MQSANYTAVCAVWWTPPKCGYSLNRFINFPMSYWSLHGALDMGLLVLLCSKPISQKVLQWAHYQNEMTTLPPNPHLLVIQSTSLLQCMGLVHIVEMRGKEQERWYSRSSFVLIRIGLYVWVSLSLPFLRHTKTASFPLGWLCRPLFLRVYIVYGLNCQGHGLGPYRAY